LPIRRTGTSSSGISFGRIEHVEIERVRLRIVEELHAQLVFRIVTGLDRLPQLAAVEVGILAGQLLRLVPDQRRYPGNRLPMILDERRLTGGIEPAIRVDAETLHVREGARDRAVRHQPHHHVGRLGRERHEVPKRVVR